MFALYAEPLTVVVRQDADIASVDDLRGARMDIGRPGSSARAMWTESPAPVDVAAGVDVDSVRGR